MGTTMATMSVVEDVPEELLELLLLLLLLLLLGLEVESVAVPVEPSCTLTGI